MRLFPLGLTCLLLGLAGVVYGDNSFYTYQSTLTAYESAGNCNYSSIYNCYREVKIPVLESHSVSSQNRNCILVLGTSPSTSFYFDDLSICQSFPAKSQATVRIYHNQVIALVHNQNVISTGLDPHTQSQGYFLVMFIVFLFSLSFLYVGARFLFMRYQGKTHLNF